MSEYIERKLLLEKRWDVPFETEDAHFVQVVDVGDILNAPTADVAQVRHGRWIKEQDGGTRCSFCAKRVRDTTGGGNAPVDMSELPYCPKCGAKMDE